jgi:hypothetical protein
VLRWTATSRACAAALIACLAGGGCELVADFDRQRIPSVPAAGSQSAAGPDAGTAPEAGPDTTADAGADGAAPPPSP